MKREDDEDVEDDCDDPAYDPLVHQAARNPKKEKHMARHMNIAAIMGALRSPKTPAGLKKGLLKKYGHMLGKEKMTMGTLATTVTPNPRKNATPLSEEEKTPKEKWREVVLRRMAEKRLIKANPKKKWYWGKLHNTNNVNIFTFDTEPTKKTHGKKYIMAGGPFSSEQRAIEAAQYQGYVIIKKI